jgi:hypothetical protein
VYYADHPVAIAVCRKRGARRNIGKKKLPHILSVAK